VPVIEQCYRELLLQNRDLDEREYADSSDPLREVLGHGDHLSQKDFDICLGFNLAGLADQPQHDSMRDLHRALIADFGV
jgi:hypothetical protein